MTIKDSDDLNLPDAPDFISAPPYIPQDELIRLCEKMLPEWNRIRYSKPEPEFVGEVFKLLD